MPNGCEEGLRGITHPATPRHRAPRLHSFSHPDYNRRLAIFTQSGLDVRQISRLRGLGRPGRHHRRWGIAPRPEGIGPCGPKL